MGADGYSDGSDDNNRDIDNENESIEVTCHLKYNYYLLFRSRIKIFATNAEDFVIDA